MTEDGDGIYRDLNANFLLAVGVEIG